MDAAYERPASSSSYFAHVPPPARLLLRVHAAEGLRHVSSHGTYCKIYVGSTEMVRGSGAFARRTQKLSTSASSHSLVELLHSPFGSGGGRAHTAQPPTTPLPPTSSSEGDLGGVNSRMRVLKTQVQKGKRPNPVWNEKFDIPVLDPTEDVLSIRVKSARLMSSPAVGACSIPIKHLAMQGAGTVDRWVDLRLGKKEAGRIRLQLRLVEPNVTRIQAQPQDSAMNDDRPSRPRNHQNSDTYLSLPTDELPDPAEASSRGFPNGSRRTHKYHRSARRFDGTLLNSSSRSLEGKKSDSSDQKVPTTPTSPRDNSASATSNESIGESEPVSDVSGSPSVSPLPKRTSIEDAAAFSDPETPTSVTKVPRASSNSLVHISEASTASTPSPPVTAVGVGLDASYANRGTMRFSELERSRMKMAEISRTSHKQVPKEDAIEDDEDDDLDEEDNRHHATKRWTGNHTKLSVLSSTLDPRESSRVDFDEEDDDTDEVLGKSKQSTKHETNHWSASGALSSTATSTIDTRDSSRVHGDSESDEEDEAEDEVSSEKKREQQRQQWQMQQRKMQLREVDEEESESSSDDSDSEDEDGFDEELELETPRMQFTPTLAKLLSRQSLNVLFDEEEDTDDELEVYKMNDDFVPILEATSPASVESIDCALRQSSFD